MFRSACNPDSTRVARPQTRGLPGGAINTPGSCSGVSAAGGPSSLRDGLCKAQAVERRRGANVGLQTREPRFGRRRAEGAGQSSRWRLAAGRAGAVNTWPRAVGLRKQEAREWCRGHGKEALSFAHFLRNLFI